MNTLKNNIKKIAAIITAGGISARFGSNKLLEIIETKSGKKSVISTTVEKFLPFCSNIIIPCHVDIQEHIKASFMCSDKIKFANFGDTRQKSVFNGLIACENLSEKPDIVLIHDGARPFIEQNTIRETIEKLKEYKGVCVGVYATDTIKIADKSGEIIKTVDRNTVFQAQTPQGFDFQTILDAHKKLQDKNFTDDSCLLEFLGEKVYALEGTVSNKKITFREDLK